MLLAQLVWRAFSLAWAKTGKRIAARMAMTAITTNSSISVNPPRERTPWERRRLACMFPISSGNMQGRRLRSQARVAPTRLVDNHETPIRPGDGGGETPDWDCAPEGGHVTGGPAGGVEELP